MVYLSIEIVAKSANMNEDTLLNLLAELDSTEVKIYIYYF